MKLKNLKGDLKQAANQVKAVHDCPSCMEHLNAIKEHQRNGHKNE